MVKKNSDKKKNINTRKKYNKGKGLKGKTTKNTNKKGLKGKSKKNTNKKGKTNKHKEKRDYTIRSL